MAKFVAFRTTSRARLAAIGLSAAFVATLVTGLGGSTAQAADSSGVLKIAMSAGNVPIPDTSCDQGAEGIRFVCDNIYDQLFNFNLDQNTSLPTPHPDLATGYSLSPDHLTWTFHLRHGVKFSDGTPFNADAVIFNWERVSNPKFKYYAPTDAASSSARTAQWKSFKKINEYTVQLTTRAPYSMELWDQASTFYASPTAVKKWGKSYPQHPVGTGPFIVKKYTNNVEMDLVANRHYWAGPPKLKEIDLYPEPEPAARLASLESGSVNWAEVPSPDAIDELKGQGFQVFEEDHHPGAIMPLFNEFRAPLNNLKLREALNYAVNRKATVAVINGTGLVASQYVAPGNPYYIPNDKGYYYDPKKAKQLLAEAGYGPGKKSLTLQMAYPPSGSGNLFPEPMMEQLQQDFKAVGVTLKITPIEWDTFNTIRTTGGLTAQQWKKYDLIWGSPPAGETPTGYETSFLCSVGGVKNYVGYCDPKNTKLFNQALRTFNVPKQNKLIQEVERNAQDDAAMLYWVIDRNLRVMSPDVHGYPQAWSWYIDFTKISVS